MHGVAFRFFLSAALYVFAGMLLGLHMAAAGDHSLAPVHAHLNLAGWTSMALFGLYYHSVPAAAETRLARVHFWIATIGLWMFVPGIAIAQSGATELPAIAGSFVVLASMTLFIWIVWETARRPA